MRLTVVKSNQEPLSNKQVLKKKKRETNSFKTQYVYSGYFFLEGGKVSGGMRENK